MAAPSLTLPSRWLAALVAAVVVVVGAIVVLLVVRNDDDDAACNDARIEASSPLLDINGMGEQPDERLDELTAAVQKMEAPIGEVVAGVGYDYDQWLRAYGVPGGVLTWTKNNAPVTLLDSGTLEPRWSLRPAGNRSAWDASEDRFLLLDLDAKKPTAVASYDLDDGSRKWCSVLGASHNDGDPVSTTFVEGGDVLTALSAGGAVAVTRLSGKDGSQVWERRMTGVDRADFLGTLSDEIAIAGGVEEFRLAEQADPGAAGDAVTAFSVEDGRSVWSWDPGAGSAAHVVGVADGRVIAVVRSASGVELVALDDEDGTVLWQVRTSGGAFEATLRGAVVVTKSPAGLVGYDARSGAERWRFPTPTDRTYFPYGFTVSQMPSLDDNHMLLPTTSSLQVLDLTTGDAVEERLPVDGVSTTYWPYQLMVTDDLIGVITNTGGVFARRE